MPLIGANSYTDMEGALKAWLRSLNIENLGTQVYLGLPREGPSSWPAVALFRIGGGPPDGADYPADPAHMQTDVWGSTGQKVTCAGVTQAIISALLDLASGTLMDENTRALGVTSVSSIYLPDKEDGRPRYSVSCIIQAQAV